MLSQYKLVHKQFALIAIVLLLELVLIVSLQIVLNQADTEAKRASRAYEVSMQATQLVKQCTDTATDLMLFGITKSPDAEQRYNTLSEEIPLKISILEKSSEEFVEDRENMRRIEVSAQTWKKVLAQIRKLLDQQSKEVGMTVYLTGFFNHDVRPHLRELSDELIVFLEQHRKVQAAQTERFNRSKSLLGYILIGGGIMQIVLAAASFVLISGSVTDRLGVLTENTLRLGRGLPLRSKIRGADEIAQLDAFFHEMAAALDSASKKERAIVDGMPVGFVTLNHSGMILTANPRILSMNKSGAGQMVGRSLTEFVEALDGTSVSFQQIKELAHGRAANFLFLRTNNSTFQAELFINSILESEHQLLICNILDISERHEIERLKKELVSIVSHDLKTPLTAIQGSLQLLGHGTFGTLNERGQQIVEGSQKEAERLVALVSDLLDVARMEAGRIELQRSTVSDKTVVSRSVNALHTLADRKSIKVETKSSETEFLADEDRLVQALVNILSNAIKYSPVDTTINIASINTDGQLEFRVSDQGPGIPMESQKRIFERFEQASTDDRTEHGGSGLGLAICKLIVEAHGGTVGVDSVQGEGSSFWFRIPVVSN